MHKEVIQINPQRNVTLTAYTQPVGGSFRYISKRPAILILPGGGYQYCSARESDPVAFAYLKAGFQTFILNYSVGKDAAWPNPLEDVECAMELIRSREEWNVYPDKVAVIGFSAGGHLAAAAATMSRNRPNAAILGYAVTGEDVRGCNPTAPDTTKFVDKNTCPCFVFATCTDDVVPVQNSIDFTSALSRAKISFESHIYAYGPHGFSTCDSSVHERSKPVCSRVPDWVEDSIGWLKDVLGDFDEGKLTDPVCGRYTCADYEKTLSIDCTVGHLLENPTAAGMLDMVTAQVPEGSDMGLLKKMTLRGILGFVGCPQETLRALDVRLRQIPNNV